MNFNIEVPKDWKKIAEDKNKLLGIESTQDIINVGAYVVGEEHNANIISFLNYQGYDIEFLKELDKHLVKINEINELINGNPNEKGYEDTSLISNIFHGFTDKYGGNLYININKMPVTESKHGYSFQIFVEVKNGLMCAQASVRELDEKNALKSAIAIDYIKEIIKILFKLK